MDADPIESRLRGTAVPRFVPPAGVTDCGVP